MKHIDFSKLRTATEAQTSETRVLFPNEFTLFIECITKEFQMYHGNKAQDFEIYNPNSESTITVIKPTAAIIDLSAIVCTKATVTAAKIFQQFLFEIVCSIQYIYTKCL